MRETGGVTTGYPHAPPTDLPPGWTARIPGPDDVADLAGLVEAHQRAVRGSSSVDRESLAVEAVGEGSWTRRQLVLVDASGAIRAWATVHDRAAGRTVVAVTVDPDLDEATRVAGSLFAWTETVAGEVSALRQLTGTQLDSGAYADDERQRTWLTEAGYRRTRTWLQMSRRVAPDETVPGPREGVSVRRVATHQDGMPVAHDLQTVHVLLEESFADHFNSYRESFPEFVQRLREDPGHRWDHWWIASVDMDGEQVPAGAVVGTVLPEDPSGKHGSYIDYIGVHRRARGRGVAKTLLHTVIADARDRGRNRVGLEVDADSPTGAQGLYESMGWVTMCRTESWHKTLTL